MRLLGRAGLLLGALRVTSSLSMSSAAPAHFVCAKDGTASPSSLPSKDWLLAQPRGAYTTARTCAGARRLFEWDMHVQRTADSAAAMLQGVPNADAILAQVGSAESLRPRLDATVGSAVRAYLASNGGDEATELKVTVLVTWTAADAAEGSGCDAASTSSVSCHVAPLPPIPSPPVRVEVRGAPRQNAAAKDSTWVTDRAPLEELMRRGWAPFNELLLVSDAGELLEGSQTNFFAVQDGQARPTPRPHAPSRPAPTPCPHASPHTSPHTMLHPASRPCVCPPGGGWVRS